MIKKPFKTILYLAIFFFLSQFAYALNIVELSPGYYPNSSRSRALSSADIYVGKPDLDPEIVANQKTLSVQQEDGTIVAVSQPIHTSAGGVPQYAGSPVTLLVEGDYSLKVLNSYGVQIYYVPSTAYEKYLVAGNYYYPDYSEADQGVVGGGETVTDILAEVGATENATIYFSHNSGGNTTTYTFTTNTTITDNFNIIIEDGAILDGAGILTPKGPFKPGQYRVFGDSITIDMSDAPILEIYPEWWKTNTTPYTTDMTTAIQAALDQRGRVILSDDYLVTGIYIRPGTVLEGMSHHVPGSAYRQASLKLAAGSDISVIMSESLEPGFAGDNNMHQIFIRNIFIDGNKDNNAATSHGIHIAATGNTASIEKCLIRNVNDDGIHLGDAGVADIGDKFSIRDVSLVKTGAYGINTESDSFTALLIESLKIDDCTSGGIRIYGGTGVGTNSVLITNYRSEATEDVAATMVNSIVFDTYTGGATIINARFQRAAGATDQKTGACVYITGGGPRLILENIAQNTPDANRAYTYLFNDVVASTTIDDDDITLLVHPPASEQGAAFSREARMYYKAGDIGFAVRKWGESYDRFTLSSNSMDFGAGSGAVDTRFYRDMALSLSLADPTNVQKTSIRLKTTEVTCNGATETWANAIPAGSIVLGLTARVTTLITGATSIDVGDADPDLYIDGMVVALNTTADLADSNAALTGPKTYQAATDITITGVGGAFTAGVLRLTLHYIDLGAPTS